MTTPLERVEQAVDAAERALFRAVHASSDLRPAIQALVAAVEARCTERVRANGWHVAASVIAPAEACQFHSPTGTPCVCGHDGGADCHPGARRTT